MPQKLKLKQRIFLILVLMVVISIGAAAAVTWYTIHIEKMLTTIIEHNMAAFANAEALENALVNQKGFVSYYFLDSDPEWLQQLNQYRQIFDQRLAEAKTLAHGPAQAEALDRIEGRYRSYVELKDKVIAQFNSGQRSASTILNQQVRLHFFDILSLCEAYKNIQTRAIETARQETFSQTAQLRIVAATVSLVGFLLAGILALILVKQILNPIARLLETTFADDTARYPDNVVAALSKSVADLIHNVDQTQSELAKSREHLLQAEKMAVVGKLAAGMAHSIRNPFTSVKMRLFSLARTLRMTAAQKEDFDVISEEIRHIDTIVQNFLEFSRPPKLAMQSIAISTIVDNTLQLLSHRLKSYDVTIELSRPHQVPPVQADPEQLKEVLVNLMVNACEAFEQRGGRIKIEEKVVTGDGDGRRRVMVRLSDSGPGIDPALHEQVFQPFFTTKEDGTGLGLSIAQRIVDEHGGRLTLESAPGLGAVFVITLPIEDMESEYDTDYR